MTETPASDSKDGIDQVMGYLQNTLNIRELTRIAGLVPKDSRRYYLLGKFDEKKVFVKWYGEKELGRRESTISDILFRCAPEHVPRPFFFDDPEAEKCYVCEFIDGDRLDFLIRETNPTDEVRETIVRQIREIAQMFLDAKILHRDFSFKNVMFSADGRLVVIDNEHGVLTTSYDENDLIDRQIQIKGIVIGRLKFDDFPAMLRLLRQIGPRASYRPLYEEVEGFLIRHIGKLSIVTRPVFYISLFGVARILRSKIVLAVTCFIPVKRWRQWIRRKFIYHIK